MSTAYIGVYYVKIFDGWGNRLVDNPHDGEFRGRASAMKHANEYLSFLKEEEQGHVEVHKVRSVR